MALSLELTDIQAGYVPGVDILRGLSLNVSPGEIVTIIGPNGSGKSTSLKVAVGYLRARTGEVSVGGQPVGHLSVDRRVRQSGIAIVPQSDNVFGALTVWENLDLGGAFMPAAERRRRIDKLLAAYPMLRRKLRDKAYSLSGGERQVLALARAVMPSPKYLLLDEPSAGLSPMMLEEVFTAIVDIVKQTGIAVLLVEQNATEALAISNRAYVLVLGQVALSGPAQTILEDENVRQLYLGGTAV
jgi:branched-chain amino acid transport system ATP-binding protein